MSYKRANGENVDTVSGITSIADDPVMDTPVDEPVDEPVDTPVDTPADAEPGQYPWENPDPDPLPTWFDPLYYAQQKVMQMAAMKWDLPEIPADTPEDQRASAIFNEALRVWNEENDANVTAYQNFWACNYYNYGEGITLADVNVSPNKFFDTNTYLQALANINNANPELYEGDVPEGGWNMVNILDLMFNTYHASAWEHYTQTWDQLAINPSNNFDTVKYVQLKAEALGQTVEDVIAAMKESGNNPIQDFMEHCSEYGITEEMVKPATEIQVELPNPLWSVWGELPPDMVPGGEDALPDPFDTDVTTVEMTAEQTTYPDEGEQYDGNTRFEAKWLTSSAESTLGKDDVIIGPEDAYNTFAVTLGRDWNGFSDDGGVSGVGRVQLINGSQNGASSMIFNAKGISEDAYRFDLIGGNGQGSISLEDLSDAVSDIYLSSLAANESGKAPAETKINFASGANQNEDDQLTLHVNKVSESAADLAGLGEAGPKAAQISSSSFGIENLVIDTAKSDGVSWLDISGLQGVQNVSFTGKGNVSLWNVPSSVLAFDASEAEGGVGIMLSNPTGETSITGGKSDMDVVGIMSGSWMPAGIAEVENLYLGDGASINLKNVSTDDVSDIWLAGGGITREIQAGKLNVHQTASTGGNVVVNGTESGSLESVNYQTVNKAAMTGLFTTNATGDVDMTIVDGSEFGGTIDLKAASTTDITVESGGKMQGATLNANTILDLNISAQNGVTLGGSAKSLQNLELDLTNSKDSGNDQTSFTASMRDIQNITINGGNQDVVIGEAGSASGENAIKVTSLSAHNLTLNGLSTGSGYNIDIDASNSGSLNFGNIASGANVNLSAYGTSAAATGAISGIDIGIDLSGLTGDAFNAQALHINSSGAITYKGADGGDSIVINGNGSAGIKGGTINLGYGADNVEFAATAAITGTSTVTVNLDNDGFADTIKIAEQTGGGTLKVVANNFTAGATGDIIQGADTTNITAADITADTGGIKASLTALLNSCGINLTGDIEGISGIDGAFMADGQIYAAGANYNALVCLGVADDLDGLVAANITA